MVLKISVTRVPTPETILGRVIGDLLEESGLEVQYFNASSGEARRISSVHEALADLGVGLAPMVRWAYRSEAAFDGWRHTSLRLLASLSCPTWFPIAVTWGARVTSLAELAERRPPLRILCYPPDGHSIGWVYVLNEILRTAGIELGDLRKAGGEFVDLTTDELPVQRGAVDLVALPYGAPGVETRTWSRALERLDLRPLDAGAAVEAVASRYGWQLRRLPSGGLLPADTPPSLYFPQTLVFASERLDDDTAHEVVSILHRHRDRLLAEGFTLDPTTAFDPDAGVRYHRAAIAYYRAAGALPTS